MIIAILLALSGAPERPQEAPPPPQAHAVVWSGRATPAARELVERRGWTWARRDGQAWAIAALPPATSAAPGSASLTYSSADAPVQHTIQVAWESSGQYVEVATTQPYPSLFPINALVNNQQDVLPPDEHGNPPIPPLIVHPPVSGVLLYTTAWVPADETETVRVTTVGGTHTSHPSDSVALAEKHVAVVSAMQHEDGWPIND